MPLLDLVTLPVRVTFAAAQVTLGLGRLADPDGPVRREGGYADRLMLVIGEGGHVEKLTVDGGTLDQLIALGDTLEEILPRLAELSEIVPELHASVDALGRAVEPLSGLVERLPGSRRRTAVEG